MKHEPAAILARPDGSIMVRCTCGEIGGGAKGLWTFEFKDGMVQTTPSIDMRGCFHTPNPSGWWPSVATWDELVDGAS